MTSFSTFVIGADVPTVGGIDSGSARARSRSSGPRTTVRRLGGGFRKRPLNGPPATCRVQSTAAQARRTIFSVAMTTT